MYMIHNLNITIISNISNMYMLIIFTKTAIYFIQEHWSIYCIQEYC